jgi:3-carboxy-cis,cis-muconate cycloisomerase
MSLGDAAIDPGFSTPAMSACFSPEAHVRTMLDVEAELAQACADLGLEARGVADEIAAACADPQLEARQVLAEGWRVGTPVVAMRTSLGRHLSSAARQALDGGHGSTTQDIVDTAMQLQIRSGLAALHADLAILTRRLALLARLHRATPMIGRTFLQHARPTTFGLCVASWLTPVAELTDAVAAAEDACSVQLGGPVGASDGWGSNGPGVGARLAERLGLHHPVAPWHTDRRHVIEPCTLAARAARAAAKVATDVAVLSSSEIDEITVRSGGSSSMAGKRNPFDSVRAIAAADACAAMLGALVGARPPELQRGLGGWHLEWLAVPMVFMTAGAALDAMARCADTIEVDGGAMEAHARAAAGDEAVDAAADHAADLVDRILHHHGLLHDR